MAGEDNLTHADLERYARQILFKSFGRNGQKRLKASHVLVAGVGGLGSPVAMYLTVSGIGRITLVDSDIVVLSNLNRQLLHWEENIGHEKVYSARDKLCKMNATIQISPVPERITRDTCGHLLVGVDVVVDCLDNMSSRYVLNQACVEKGLPLIHGGVYGMMGQLTTIIPGKTPCLECIFPSKKEKKGSIPVFGPAAGLIASLQSMEVIKLLSGTGETLLGKLLYFNGEVMECVTADVTRNEDCPVCGSSRIIPGVSE
jgi:adenylyltransferase/sulfurtransferase